MEDLKSYIIDLIDLAIKEDIGDGDHSSLSSIPMNAKDKMKLLIKQDCVLAGVGVAKLVFKRLDPNVVFEQILNDGDKVKVGDIAFYVEGRTVSLLQSERVVLNIMQRMSGVATKTNMYASCIEDLNTMILDTRKTTPGMRAMDKMAVKIGGGENHRMGLFDMIMLKDNHIDFAGGITAAVAKVNEYKISTNKKHLRVEVETRTLDDVREVMSIEGVDRIMLDNFSTELTREAVVLVHSYGKPMEIESSGGITLSTLRDYALCGVDFISIGAITHQVESIDMSLKACEQ